MQPAAYLVDVSETSADCEKLTVLTHADVVGYRRLVGVDDAGTAARLPPMRREIIEPMIIQNGGMVRQTAGDSLLVVFDCIDGALRSAIAIRRAIAAFDKDDPIEVQTQRERNAAEYVALRQQSLTLLGDDPKRATLRKQVEVALGEASFAAARAQPLELGNVNRMASLALVDKAKECSLAAARSLQQSARVRVAAWTLHDPDAANDLKSVVALALPFDRHRAWQLMIAQATMLGWQGYAFGDNAAVDQKTREVLTRDPPDADNGGHTIRAFLFGKGPDCRPRRNLPECGSGESVFGLCRQRAALASGRFAMIDGDVQAVRALATDPGTEAGLARVGRVTPRNPASKSLRRVQRAGSARPVLVPIGIRGYGRPDASSQLSGAIE